MLIAYAVSVRLAPIHRAVVGFPNWEIRVDHSECTAALCLDKIDMGTDGAVEVCWNGDVLRRGVRSSKGSVNLWQDTGMVLCEGLGFLFVLFV